MAHHHHRHGEMKHHKERHSHKEAHRAKKDGEHSLHAAMVEHHHGMPPKALGAKSSLEHDNHQEGISRKILRHGEKEVGHHGKMLQHEHHKNPHGHSHHK